MKLIIQPGDGVDRLVKGIRKAKKSVEIMRLHTRTIIRDRSQAFIGSQSLRQLELDARREIGVIFRDATILKDLCRVFEEDWINSAPEEEPEKHDEAPPKKAVKKLARKVVKRIALAPVAKKVTKIISKKANGNLDKKQIHETVMELVEDVVKEAAQQGAVEGAKTVS